MSITSRYMGAVRKVRCFPQAVRYLEWGWQPIPLIGKQPPKNFPLKSLFQADIPSMERLLPWLPPCYEGNLGIITGEISDLVVIDYDSEDAIVFGEKHFTPTPFRVKTGNSGRHAYYRYPRGALIGCRAGLFGQKLDLRANNGFVAAPPSVHPKTGITYQWEKPLAELNLSDMPVFNPAWLPLSPKRTVRNISAHPASNEQLRRAKNYLSKIKCVSGQNAHNTFYRACCQLADHFHLSEFQLYELICEWNQTNCFDSDGKPYPWSEPEILHKVRDVFNR